MSPPKHTVKLPYWSSPWYHQYHRDLACHMYVSYINSLIACLPPLVLPRFGSEAEPNVLYLLSLPCGPVHYPWGVYATALVHRNPSLCVDYGNNPLFPSRSYCSRWLMLILSLTHGYVLADSWLHSGWLMYILLSPLVIDLIRSVHILYWPSWGLSYK